MLFVGAYVDRVSHRHDVFSRSGPFFFVRIWVDVSFFRRYHLSALSTVIVVPQTYCSLRVRLGESPLRWVCWWNLQRFPGESISTWRSYFLFFSLFCLPSGVVGSTGFDDVDYVGGGARHCSWVTYKGSSARRIALFKSSGAFFFR